MEIKAADVMKLRKMTGAGMMDCKKALQEAEGDFDRAKDIIREKGKLVVAKRSDRTATEGVVVTKIVGDKGYILGDFMSADVIVGHIDGTKEVFPATRTNFDNVYREEWDVFLRAIRGECKVENPPEQAIVSTLLMHSQIESAKAGHEINIHELAQKHGYSF